MTRILFVCLGNICRSAAAEAVMKRRVEEAADLTDRVFVDSAGTGDWHVGERADPRMRMFANDRGYNITSRARQLQPDDLVEFDLVIPMDASNLRHVKRLAEGIDGKAEVRPFCDFCRHHERSEVPDPYFGGDDGFSLVMDILEDGCEGVLEHVKKKEAK